MDYLFGEKPHEQDAAGPPERVHRRGAERVVDLPLVEKHPRHALEHERGHGAVDDRRPRLQHVGAGGDRHEPDEDAVAQGEEVPRFVPGRGSGDIHTQAGAPLGCHKRRTP